MTRNYQFLKNRRKKTMRIERELKMSFGSAGVGMEENTKEKNKK